MLACLWHEYDFNMLVSEFKHVLHSENIFVLKLWRLMSGIWTQTLYLLGISL